MSSDSQAGYFLLQEKQMRVHTQALICRPVAETEKHITNPV